MLSADVLTIEEGSLDLVGVTFEPWRAGLPIRKGSVFITNWHLDLRQTLGVQCLVVRDDIVDGEQIRRQLVDLIGRERPLSVEGHPTIDVIPDRRRERRAKRQDSPSRPD